MITIIEIIIVYGGFFGLFFVGLLFLNSSEPLAYFFFLLALGWNVYLLIFKDRERIRNFLENYIREDK